MKSSPFTRPINVDTIVPEHSDASQSWWLGAARKGWREKVEAEAARLRNSRGAQMIDYNGSLTGPLLRSKKG